MVPRLDLVLALLVFVREFLRFVDRALDLVLVEL
jgi:hypothetical protein